jgi:hypothetical protein
MNPPSFDLRSSFAGEKMRRQAGRWTRLDAAEKPLPLFPRQAISLDRDLRIWKKRRLASNAELIALIGALPAPILLNGRTAITLELAEAEPKREALPKP